MGKISDLAERHWQGDGDLVFGEHPVRPIADLAAEEIADGVLYIKSIASMSALDTGDGLVMLDTGGMFDRDVVYDGVRAWRPDSPLTDAVYSHHHIDHVFGTARFEAEAVDRGWVGPTVYGHAAIPDHFRRYQRTRGWNSAINKRQFGLPVESFEWPGEYRFPDVTYDDHMTFRRGTLTFELHHARGETDDATWTWVPEARILHPGDLFIWAVPNAGNPQKVQRYLSDWAVALRKMAGMGADIMVSGHGLPVFGADRIAVALSDTADLLDSIETQVLELMNTGATLDRVIHEVEVPARLADRPYLRPVYDHPQFLVRNVWRRYGGWYDGEPDQLLPAPRRQQAKEWVDMAGGVSAVLRRAAELAGSGDLRLACHLVEYAVLAEPESDAAHDARADVYARRAAEQESSMARNLMVHAAEASLRRRRDLAGPG
ncbi:MBL fold metallo-hydrolase [Acidiferrimicrobium sp. IK]|uniref:alkyl sulfatase dimerization domain-containing protein n=1 Tax=Acidiferrimicrobium sp. IK TaxID=2871700 RepID=UPI0021CB2DC7|nr:alkyl sulfatase dimerization domain-containing protein [Acidiferrimicrobium sp. IK]MCU4183001.1 MBL fold metallo-hydrolase [Acidiferrimicrobium sp. IK]